MTSDEPPNPASALPAIVVDRICVSCGYNLRGLTADGVCPECGQPVALSFRSDLLAYSNPDWRRRVALGAKMLTWALLWLMALRLLGIYHSVRSVVSIAWYPLVFHEPWRTLTDMVYDSCVVIATWKVTSFELVPDRASAASAARVRLFTGIGLVISIMFWTCLSSGNRMERSLLMVAGSVVGAVEVDLLYRYLAKLARRLPDPTLARRFALLSTLYPCSILAGQTLHWVLYLGGIGPYREQTLIALPGMIASLFCVIVAFWLLNEFSHRLGEVGKT